MKKIFPALILNILFCTIYAQSINPTDSISTGTNYTQMVFYNLSTGVKTSSPDTDWNIAVTVRPTDFPYHPLGGTTIRCNEANGVAVYISPDANATSFSSLDTSGWENWQRLHDSDSDIDLGAFNSTFNPTDIFNYGWGEYNENTHNVIGDSIFLIQLPDGELKKFLVVGLFFDTAFDLEYANIDNSDSQYVHIGKGEYHGKDFVYLNLADNVIHDKEPLNTDWDLLAIHCATGLQQGSVTTQTGVWLNDNDSASVETHVDVNNTNYPDLPFADSLDIVGWNWQVYNSSNQTYSVQDSLAYFIKNPGGQVYKFVFTSFGGPATGTMGFNNQQVHSTASIITMVKNTEALNIFPNPADNVLNIYTENASSTFIKVFDITGKLLSENELTGNNTQINTSGFPEGLYLLNIAVDGQTPVYGKFVVEH